MAWINATGAKALTPREQAAYLKGILDARDMAMIAASTIEALHPFGVENEQRFQTGGPVFRVAPRIRSYSGVGSGRSSRGNLASA